MPMSDFPIYELTDEHKAIREAVRDLCDAKVAPFAAAWGATAIAAVEAAAPRVINLISTSRIMASQ